MKTLFILIIILLSADSHSQNLKNVIISEVVTNGTVSDWVEIKCIGSSVDVSQLYITGYYGTEEKISDQSITLYPEDNPATPYDDRFLVVYFKDGIDETDYTGDTNRNGILEAYISNSTPPWNTEGVIAIDDNALSSDGMIDFVAYDCNDLLNESISGYLNDAVSINEWNGTSVDFMINIPADGLKSFQSISRMTGDTNTKNDYAITSSQTPGKENENHSIEETEGLFQISGDKIIIRPNLNCDWIDVKILSECSLKLRVYSTNGKMVCESELLQDLSPGNYKLRFPAGKVKTGLYIGHITAQSSILKISKTKKISFAVSRFR